MTNPTGRRVGRPIDLRLRAGVLAATAALLTDLGYDAMTMDQIAARSGTAKQTLYRIWGSKVEVAADAVLQGAYSLHAEPVPDTGDLLVDLASWLIEIGRMLQRPTVMSLIRALATASTSAGDDDRIDAFDRVVTDPFAQLLRGRLEEAIRLDPSLAGMRVGVVIDLIVGYLTLASIGRVPLDRERVEELIAVLLPRPGR